MKLEKNAPTISISGQLVFLFFFERDISSIMMRAVAYKHSHVQSPGSVMLYNAFVKLISTGILHTYTSIVINSNILL